MEVRGAAAQPSGDVRRSSVITRHFPMPGVRRGTGCTRFWHLTKAAARASTTPQDPSSDVSSGRSPWTRIAPFPRRSCSCLRSNVIGVRDIGYPCSSDPWARRLGDMLVPALCPGHAFLTRGRLAPPILCQLILADGGAVDQAFAVVEHEGRDADQRIEGTHRLGV